MFSAALIFVLALYTILEISKYSNSGVMAALKNREMQLKYSQCIIKLVVISLSPVLYVLSRLFKEGEESGIGGFFIMVMVLGGLITLSVTDVKKARTERGTATYEKKPR